MRLPLVSATLYQPLIIDEIGDKKKGNKTDYVKRQ